MRSGGCHFAAQEAKESIDKLIEADAYDNIFPVMAHDSSLAGIVDVYPKTANSWMAKRWKEKSRWGLLSSFTVCAEDHACNSDESQNSGDIWAEGRNDSRAA